MDIVDQQIFSCLGIQKSNRCIEMFSLHIILNFWGVLGKADEPEAANNIVTIFTIPDVWRVLEKMKYNEPGRQNLVG